MMKMTEMQGWTIEFHRGYLCVFRFGILMSFLKSTKPLEFPSNKKLWISLGDIGVFLF